MSEYVENMVKNNMLNSYSFRYVKEKIYKVKKIVVKGKKKYHGYVFILINYDHYVSQMIGLRKKY